MENNICHDCKKDMLIEEDEIKNGVRLEYQNKCF